MKGTQNKYAWSFLRLVERAAALCSGRATRGLVEKRISGCPDWPALGRKRPPFGRASRTRVMARWPRGNLDEARIRLARRGRARRLRRQPGRFDHQRSAVVL